MTRANICRQDLTFDLAFERNVDVPPGLVWAAWTTPEQVEEMVHACALDHRRLRN
jgi:uncharacterized protein YndB with AHSA1/START domain